VVLGVIFVLPLTFWVVFFIGPLWFLIVGIWGMRRELSDGAVPATA
jgi:hypothetical protein